jgi:hypothetical protein
MRELVAVSLHSVGPALHEAEATAFELFGAQPIALGNDARQNHPQEGERLHVAPTFSSTIPAFLFVYSSRRKIQNHPKSISSDLMIRSSRLLNIGKC